jgi:hypothetical protein
MPARLASTKSGGGAIGAGGAKTGGHNARASASPKSPKSPSKSKDTKTPSLTPEMLLGGAGMEVSGLGGGGRQMVPMRSSVRITATPSAIRAATTGSLSFADRYFLPSFMHVRGAPPRPPLRLPGEPVPPVILSWRIMEQPGLPEERVSEAYTQAQQSHQLCRRVLNFHFVLSFFSCLSALLLQANKWFKTLWIPLLISVVWYCFLSHPLDHELVFQGWSLAGADPELREELMNEKERQKWNKKFKSNSAAQANAAQEMVRSARTQQTASPSSPPPSSSAAAGALSAIDGSELPLQRLTPTPPHYRLLSVPWRCFAHTYSTDIAAPGGAAERASVRWYNSTVRDWIEHTAANKLELYAAVMEGYTKPGMGPAQIKITGYKKPSQQGENNASPSSGVVPPLSAALPGGVAWSAAIESLLRPYSRDWTLHQLDVLFPLAQPHPVLFRLAPGAQAFARLEGVDAGQAHPLLMGASNDSRSAVRTRWELEKRLTIDFLKHSLTPHLSPLYLLSAWALLTLAGLRVLRGFPWDPRQVGLSKRFLRNFRSRPDARRLLELRDDLTLSSAFTKHGPGAPWLEVFLRQSELAQGPPVHTPPSTWLSVVGPRELSQTYQLRSHAAVGTLRVFATKQPFASLFGKVYYGRWAVTRVSLAVRGKKTLYLARTGKDGRSGWLV